MLMSRSLGFLWRVGGVVLAMTHGVRGQPSFCPDADAALLNSCGTFCPNGDALTEEQRATRLDTAVNNIPVEFATCGFVQDNIYPCLQAQRLECGSFQFQAISDCGCDKSEIPYDQIEDDCFLCPNNEPYTADPNSIADESRGFTCEIASWWAYAHSGASNEKKQACLAIQETLGAACGCPKNTPDIATEGGSEGDATAAPHQICTNLDQAKRNTCGTFCPNGDALTEEQRAIKVNAVVNNFPVEDATCGFLEDNIYPCLQAEFFECGAFQFKAISDCGCDKSEIPYDDVEDDCFLCPNNEPYLEDPSFVVDPGNGFTCQLASWLAFASSGSSQEKKKECLAVQETLGTACGCPNAPSPGQGSEGNVRSSPDALCPDLDEGKRNTCGTFCPNGDTLTDEQRAIKLDATINDISVEQATCGFVADSLYPCLQAEFFECGDVQFHAVNECGCDRSEIPYDKVEDDCFLCPNNEPYTASPLLIVDDAHELTCELATWLAFSSSGSSAEKKKECLAIQGTLGAACGCPNPPEPEAEQAGSELFCPHLDKAKRNTCGTFCPNGDALSEAQRAIRLDTWVNDMPLENTTCGFIADSLYPCLQAESFECGDFQFQAVSDCGCDMSEIPYDKVEDDCFLCRDNEPYTKDPSFLVDPGNGFTCELASWLAYSSSGSSKEKKTECLEIQGTLGAGCGCPNPPDPHGATSEGDVPSDLGNWFCPDLDKDRRNTCGTFCPNGDVLTEEQRAIRLDSQVNGMPVENATCGFLEDNLYPCLQAESFECGDFQFQAISDCGCDKSEIPYDKVEDDCFLCPNNEPYVADPSFVVDPATGFTCELASWLAYSSSGSSDEKKKECLDIQGTLGAGCGCPNPPNLPKSDSEGDVPSDTNLFCPDLDEAKRNTCGTFCPNGDALTEEQRAIKLDAAVNGAPVENATCGFIQDHLYPCLQAEFFECGDFQFQAIRDCGCDKSEIPYDDVEDDCFLCPNNEPYSQDPSFLVDPGNGFTCELASWLAYSSSGSSNEKQKECVAIQGTLGAACGCPNPPDPPELDSEGDVGSDSDNLFCPKLEKAKRNTCGSFCPNGDALTAEQRAIRLDTEVNGLPIENATCGFLEDHLYPCLQAELFECGDFQLEAIRECGCDKSEIPHDKVEDDCFLCPNNEPYSADPNFVVDPSNEFTCELAAWLAYASSGSLQEKKTECLAVQGTLGAACGCPNPPDPPCNACGEDQEPDFEAAVASDFDLVESLGLTDVGCTGLFFVSSGDDNFCALDGVQETLASQCCKKRVVPTIVNDADKSNNNNNNNTKATTIATICVALVIVVAVGWVFRRKCRTGRDKVAERQVECSYPYEPQATIEAMDVSLH